MSERKERLRELLQGCRPDDPRERDHRRRMLELLETVEDPFSRSTFAPGHFSASAYLLDPANGRLLLIHHDRLDRWLQPGGHVEPGDADLRSAAGRELLEETGLVARPHSSTAPFDLDIHTIPAGRGEPVHLHHDVRFLFQPAQGIPRAGEGVRQVRWFDVDRLDSFDPEGSGPRIARKLQQIVHTDRSMEIPQ